jgi:two-component sensor histidine kinase
MIQAQDRLTAALEEQELLTREMGHRVKNLFAVAGAMVHLSARTSAGKEQMAETLSGRLQALAGANALVRRTFSPDGKTSNVSHLSEILTGILRPYAPAATVLAGPPVHVGEHATNSIALVFHEMATNAAKYDCFTTDEGALTVRWSIDEGQVRVIWKETGGPPPVEPEATGFGTSLVRSTITHHGGTIATSWQSDGVEVEINLPLSSLTR